MNTYAYIIKAKAKATDSKSLFCWFSAKSDSRAEREILNLLEDSGIEVGRGADHQLPIRTNWFVVDDLPEEGTLDDTWCDRYELSEDGLTWKKIVVAETPAEPESTVLETGEQPANDATPEVNENIQHEQNLTEGKDSPPEYPKLTAVPTMSFRHRVLAQVIGGGEYMYHVDEEQKKEIIALELDQDNSYIQNLLLAAENVEPFKKANEVDIWKAVNSVKTVFPVDKKTPELASVIQFLNAWFNTEHIDRGLLTKEWAKGNRLSCIQRTSDGANAGGGIKTDRNPDYIHTLETLDYEIATATLPMDFDIYNIPLSIHRRAKEIITKKESPFKEWSVALRETPGILDYSRAAIFALIRGTSSELVKFSGRLRAYINANLSESNHEKPTADTLAASRQINSASVTLDAVHDAINGKNETTIPDGVGEEYAFVGNKLVTEARSRAEQPNIENHGNGVFSIDSLVNTPPAQPLSVVDQVRQHSAEEKIKSDNNEEATSDVQMEEVVHDEAQAGTEVSQGETTTLPDESADASGEQTDAVNNESVHQITEQKSDKLYSHLMVDMETMGCDPDAAIVSIGGVFFDPSSGNTGAEFYQVVRLESSMSFGMKPDASTIEWWLKQSPEARSAILVDDAMGLLETLELLADFIAENAANGCRTVQLWGNGCSFDNVILRRAFALTDTPFPVPYWNDRDVRTMVELGKSVGINPRFDIPFEGDMHNALSDARHQVKYVSAIWQRLTAN
ncbi:3'-5' exonuclease [Citrobacter amalonaticus]|uniref:exonuclease n=1 Tax=Citrobacter amalonaticus TaxID=35703 RepID=UPI00397C5D25